MQVIGNSDQANHQFAGGLLAQDKQVPGTVDVRIQQPFDQPKLHPTVDRARARETSLTTRDVASSMLVSLSGSFQTSPAFWLDPRTGR